MGLAGWQARAAAVFARISRFEKSNAWGATKPRGKRLGAAVLLGLRSRPSKTVPVDSQASFRGSREVFVRGVDSVGTVSDLEVPAFRKALTKAYSLAAKPQAILPTLAFPSERFLIRRELIWGGGRSRVRGRDRSWCP